MIVETGTEKDLIIRHLKEVYSLGCKFEQLNRSVQSNSSTFEITENVLVDDLLNFYIGLGFHCRIYNSEGLTIPFGLTLKEAKKYTGERSDDYDFQQLLNTLNTISESTDYSDIEWAKRLFVRASKKAKNLGEKELVNKILEELLEENDKFTDSDYKEVIKLTENFN